MAGGFTLLRGSSTIQGIAKDEGHRVTVCSHQMWIHGSQIYGLFTPDVNSWVTDLRSVHIRCEFSCVNHFALWTFGERIISKFTKAADKFAADPTPIRNWIHTGVTWGPVKVNIHLQVLSLRGLLSLRSQGFLVVLQLTFCVADQCGLVPTN